MSHVQTIEQVRCSLCEVFAAVDEWFERPSSALVFRPRSGTWSIGEVLEHITVTNHFLLKTLQKQLLIAKKRSARGLRLESSESDLNRMVDVGVRGSFSWVRPEHMEPRGEESLGTIRKRMREQLGECMMALERMPDGIGQLVQVTMTVNDLGKIDLYQWLYFIALHAKRHLDQLDELYAEYLATQSD